MDKPTDIPSEMQSVLDTMSAERPEVREMFRYALVLMMIDDEKARVIGTRTENDQELIAVRTITGDEFEFVYPAL